MSIIALAGALNLATGALALSDGRAWRASFVKHEQTKRVRAKRANSRASSALFALVGGGLGGKKTEVGATVAQPEHKDVVRQLEDCIGCCVSWQLWRPFYPRVESEPLSGGSP